MKLDMPVTDGDVTAAAAVKLVVAATGGCDVTTADDVLVGTEEAGTAVKVLVLVAAPPGGAPGGAPAEDVVVPLLGIGICAAAFL